MASYAERALAPLDELRSTLLRALGRYGRVFIASRDARVLLYASVSTSITLALTLLAPMWLLAFGPLVLGIPHLVADARYLIARPKLYRRKWLAALVGAPLAATWIWPTASVALIGIVAVAIASVGAWQKRAVLFVAGASAVGAARHFGYSADVLLAHVHNFVALILWWLVAKRSARHLIPLLLVAVGIAIIFFTQAAEWTVATHHLHEFGATHITEFIQSLSPVSDPVWGLKWALFFAFTQSTHYSVWLRLMPEDAREREGVRSFASTWRALIRDCGGWFVGIATALALGVLAYAFVDAHAARIAYLRFVFFHGYMEIAVLALFFVEGASAFRNQREARA